MRTAVRTFTPPVNLLLLPAALSSRPSAILSARAARHPAVAASAFSSRPQKPPPNDGSEVPKKRHALLTFGFTGTDYYGLQSQTAAGDPERPTVSDVVRAALLSEGFIAESNFVTLMRTKWSLASRTDKGVHAAGAAASVYMETLRDDVLTQPELEDLGDPAAIERAEAAYAAEAANAAAAMEAAGDSSGRQKPPKMQAVPTEEWQLSASALARINAALPPSVRVFSATKVRKRFDARECASSRVNGCLSIIFASLTRSTCKNMVISCFK